MRIRHSVQLDQLIDLISDRIWYYVQTYYQMDPADSQPQKDTCREALEQEKGPDCPDGEAQPSTENIERRASLLRADL